MANKSSQKAVSQDFITGLLLGFLVAVYVLFIVMPMLTPPAAVAPSANNLYLK